MKRSRLSLIGLIAAAGLALAGCGSSSTGPASSAPAGGQDTSLTDVQTSGVLKVGTEGTYKPFSFHASGNGELTGYDVEIISAVANKLGVKPNFQETQFDAIFAGLEAKRFDVIANQVSITDERKAKYEFSTPYTVSTGVIVTKADDNSITSFDSLKGKTTAQSLTSNWYKLAQQSGANVQAVEGWAQAITLLKQGRVDATINDKLTYLDQQKADHDQSIKIAAETSDKSLSAFAIRKGATSLTDAINKALGELQADGTLQKISQKYFDADVTK
ncbi:MULTISPECIES: amino acid ABC transporter substrate-binding protein [Arthrobacter]|uniref:amino acid ABC transporter substrate-binding protein n=1 Tax=Arthrobacter TaxID=1663 RepID=UPI001F239C76|nr:MULTISPECIES: amino acid ABC transporter substrate-binding protein [Arthrobacter]MDP9989063.1 cystine transport system substrate-binding protein [Arthrobacter oryzae]UKA77176.1 amino acid ABC transporter substrate-binding protein [Arthrobacter sp. FW306-07-I]